MAWFNRSERGIGRGEVAESRIEAPFFAAFMMVCAIALFVFYAFTHNANLTIAMAVSMIVFGATLIRVRVGIYILAVSMLLSPEIEAGAVGPNAERGLNLRYDDILIVVIFLGVLVKLAFEGKPMLWRPNPINPGIFVYYFVCIVSTLLALRLSVPAWDKSVAFFVMLKMLEFYMIFVMVGLAINSQYEIRRQLVVFFAVAVVVCLYAIYSIGALDRVSAPMEAGGTEPNTLGGYLTIIICTATGLFFHAPAQRTRLILAVIAILAFIPFVMTLSRASYIALLVALTALGLLGRKPVVLGGVIAVLLLSPLLMPQDVLDRVNYTFQQTSGKDLVIAGRETGLQVDTSTYERIYVWQKVRYNLSIWPWFGGGVSWETVLDSQYARVLIETGIIGFLAFLFLLYRVWKTTRQGYLWSRDWVVKGLALGVCASLVGLTVHGMGTITFLIVRIMEPFWYLVALTVVGREIAIRDYVARARTMEETARPAPEEPAVVEPVGSAAT